MGRHGDEATLGQQEVRALGEFLDETEDVIPTSAVESDDVVAQFEQDFVHLERGQNRLDQHRALDRAVGETQTTFCKIEHLRPEPRLAMTLHLRQIEVRTRAARSEFAVVVKEVQAKVH